MQFESASRAVYSLQSSNKGELRSETGDCPQQPADVVARSTAQSVQRIAERTLQPAPIHAVVGLGVSDQRLDGLTALEQSFLVIAERLVLAPMDDLRLCRDKPAEK